MKTNLKGDIWIEGFDVEFDLKYNRKRRIIYTGITSEISEDIATQCCKYSCNWDGDVYFMDYGLNHETHNFKTAKESILSACDKPYCIIYKAINE